MNENEFFRKAALDICENLKIEQAMPKCVGTIRNLVPVERVGRHVLREIVNAGAKSFFDLQVPV